MGDALFLCQNLSKERDMNMVDTELLYKKLTEDKSLQGIPIVWIVTVAVAIMGYLPECVKKEEMGE